MTNGEDTGNAESAIGKEVKEQQEKEVISKVEFAKDGSSVSVYLSMDPRYINTAVFTLEKLKFDLLTMMQDQRKQEIIMRQKQRDILQARDPMATNAKKDKGFFKKHFQH